VFDWQFARFTPSGVVLLPLSGPLFTPDLDGEYVLRGVPKLADTDPANLPTDATWANHELELTYAVPPTSSSTLLMPSNDPAFRSNFGAYMSAKKLPLQPTAPVPQDTTLDVPTLNADRVEFPVNTANGRLFINGAPTAWNTTQDVLSGDSYIVNDLLTFSFYPEAQPGDQIIWTRDATAFLNETGGTLAAFNIVLP
jgi:hypothetical protein